MRPSLSLLAAVFVATVVTAVQVHDHLGAHIDADDRLFVLRSGREAAWWRPMCEDKWLVDNL